LIENRLVTSYVDGTGVLVEEPISATGLFGANDSEHDRGRADFCTCTVSQRRAHRDPLGHDPKLMQNSCDRFVSTAAIAVFALECETNAALGQGAHRDTLGATFKNQWFGRCFGQEVVGAIGS
jgi:hypothetical protein